MHSKYYGDIDINNAEEYYESEIELDAEKIQIDMWFEEKWINESVIRDADNFLNEFRRFYEISKSSLEKDFGSGLEVKEYLEHHLDQLNESEQIDLGLNPTDDLPKKTKDLYAKLHLKRVGLYPTGAFGAEFAIFDFTIGADLTQYLVVIKMNKEGIISELTTES